MSPASLQSGSMPSAAAHSASGQQPVPVEADATFASALQSLCEIAEALEVPTNSPRTLLKEASITPSEPSLSAANPGELDQPAVINITPGVTKLPLTVRTMTTTAPWMADLKLTNPTPLQNAGESSDGTQIVRVQPQATLNPTAPMAMGTVFSPASSGDVSEDPMESALITADTDVSPEEVSAEQSIGEPAKASAAEVPAPTISVASGTQAEAVVTAPVRDAVPEDSAKASLAQAALRAEPEKQGASAIASPTVQRREPSVKINEESWKKGNGETGDPTAPRVSSKQASSLPALEISQASRPAGQRVAPNSDSSWLETTTQLEPKLSAAPEFRLPADFVPHSSRLRNLTSLANSSALDSELPSSAESGSPAIVEPQIRPAPVVAVPSSSVSMIATPSGTPANTVPALPQLLVPNAPGAETAAAEKVKPEAASDPAAQTALAAERSLAFTATVRPELKERKSAVGISEGQAGPFGQQISAQSSGSRRGEVATAMPAARVADILPDAPPQTSPAQVISVRVGKEANAVDLRFVHRGGETQMAVRTDNPELIQRLRTDLPELAKSLGDRGFQVETRAGNTTSSDTENPSNRRGQRDGNEFQRNGNEFQEDQRRPKHRPQEEQLEDE
ncbi:MAG: hypothetical protein H7039_24495 [Bryobacteraceae bacterium]|nr:hypothetical protein [Bryobacteraceae bacterium]